jgi:hypothetical protein
LGQPPDQRKLHQRRTEKRKSLAGPNGKEADRPMLWDGLIRIFHSCLNNLNNLILNFKLL